MAKELPIVYVRGYAGRQAEVEDTVDDPFYGFNIGSTHIRMDGNGQADFFAFESPLVRLMSDQGYREVYDGSLQSAKNLEALHDKNKTVWIYRYYDPTSKTFDRPGGRRLSIEEAATGLRDFIQTVREETGAPKVYIICHSMGGLVSRCLIQKIYPKHSEKAGDHIDKLFTYGTPHGGIEFDIGGGVIEKIRDLIGANQSDDFGPKRMREYLTPELGRGAKKPKNFDPRTLPEDAFDADRVFCVVGTNAHDYEVAMGLSRTLAGPQSDGLVQMENAYVYDSHRAYVHRSHSGRYGMVNSEEGYQNLQRFLFGDVRVKGVLCDFKLDFKPQPDEDDDTEITYFFEVQAAIRGLPVLLHERTFAHNCPMPLNQAQYEGQIERGLPLFTSFLRQKLGQGGTMRYMLRLAIYRQAFRERFSILKDHVERLPLWSDHLVLDLERKEKAGGDISYSGMSSWASEQREPHEPIVLDDVDDGKADINISLPDRAKVVLGPKACLRFETSDWD